MSHLKPAILIAALGFALLPFLEPTSVISTGEQTNWESGIATFVQTTETSTQTVIFPTAFSTPPNVTANIINIGNGWPIGGNVYRWECSVLATDPPMIWTAMPAGQTELLGNANHELRCDTQQLTNFGWQVVVTTADASGTAVLRLQISINGGTTWTDVTGCDLNISTIGIKTALSTCTLSSVVQSINTLFRVTGINGDGVSSPAFTRIAIFSSRKIQSWTVVILNSAALPITTTQFRFQFTMEPLPIAAGVTISVEWVAQICTNGGISC